ncbi:MAG: DNA gyrase inhibitor YacG [Gammaproteobacteria bacterium]|nr:MAG: DNA gyrase inhibitor YacG [Gammaproteobacteria bacterium]
MVKIVQCPQCNKDVPWQQDEQWKPFCSHRCKLIDLGEWASEGHKIAGEPTGIEIDPEQFNPSDYH